MRKVYITGTGIIAPNGNSVDIFWSSLIKKKTGISLLTRFSYPDYPVKVAGEIKNFENNDLKALNLGLSQQFLIRSVEQALNEANLYPGLLDPQRTKILTGTSTSNMDLLSHPPNKSRVYNSQPGSLNSALIDYFDLDCDSIITISDACSSGLKVVAIASEMISKNECDIAICNAAESSISKYTLDSFIDENSWLSFESNPEKACLPFDLNRTSPVMGEGAATVILQSEDSIKTKKSIQAIIKGYHNTFDKRKDLPLSKFKECMQKTIFMAQIDPHKITYINCHAPGDLKLDAMEAKKIYQLFNSFKIGTSLKGWTSSPFSVASMYQIIASVKSVTENIIFPTSINTKDPKINLIVPDQPISINVDNVLINSHGVTGDNTCLIIGKI